MLHGSFKYGRAIIGTVFAFIIAYIIFQVVSALNSSVQTVRAQVDSFSVTIDGTALIIRDEQIITDSISSSYTIMPDEGEKISVGDSYMHSFSSSGEYDSYIKYTELNGRYKLLSDIYNKLDSSYNIGNINSDIYKLLSEIDADSSICSPSEISDNKSKLATLILTRKYALSGKDSLKSEIDSISSEIKSLDPSSYSDYSPKSEISGYYSSFTDGYENILNTTMAGDITLAQLEEYIDNPVVSTPENGSGKLITGFKWDILLSVSPADAGRLDKGSYYSMKICGQNIKACLTSTREDESGKYILYFVTKESISDFTSVRTADIRITAEEYTGYRIPRDALRVSEGQTGVYCLQGYQAVFVSVNILYSTDSFYIAEADFSSTDGLFANDCIILNTRGIYDGKIITNNPG